MSRFDASRFDEIRMNDGWESRIVNGMDVFEIGSKEFPDEEERGLLEDVFVEVKDRTHCPYCRTKLEEAAYEYDRGRSFHYGRFVTVCVNCAYWHYSTYSACDGYPMSGVVRKLCVGKLRYYGDRFPSECDHEVAQLIRRSPGFWNEFSPTKLEKFVAALFRANYNHSEVIHVGRPNDGGVDVLFIDSGGKQWLIQVKRRSDLFQSEGVETLRNLMGAMLEREVFNGVIASTADHFTTYATMLSRKMAPRGVTVRMFDRGVLHRMLGALLPAQPWLPAVKRHNPRLVRYFSRYWPDGIGKNLTKETLA